jgi:hypothetical protein
MDFYTIIFGLCIAFVVVLKLPGAQQPEQQLDGYHRYDTTLGAWLDRFLDYWLDDKVELAHI